MKRKTNHKINKKPQEEYGKSVQVTNDLIAFEDYVQTTAYSIYNHDNPKQQVDNMFSMLGADISDEDDYYDEPTIEMG